MGVAWKAVVALLVIGAGLAGCSHEAAIARQAVKLQSADAVVRREAVIALGEARDAKAIPVLAEMLNDSDTVVRANAAAALGRIGDGSAAPALRKALSDRKHWVRWDAARALGLIGDKSAVPDLVRALTLDTNANVRRAAAEALATIGDKSVVPSLIKAVGDSDDSVSYEASRALEALTDQAFGLNQVQWREWWEKEGKKSAATAEPKGDSEATARETKKAE